jgi:hypothetical protein
MNGNVSRNPKRGETEPRPGGSFTITPRSVAKRETEEWGQHRDKRGETEPRQATIRGSAAAAAAAKPRVSIVKTFSKGDTVEVILEGDNVAMGTTGLVMGFKQEGARVVVKLSDGGGFRALPPAHLAALRSQSLSRANSEDFRTRLQKAKDEKYRQQQEEAQRVSTAEVSQDKEARHQLLFIGYNTFHFLRSNP